MILLLDNYDSFTYNLAQYLGQMGQQLEVRRNDQITLDEIEQLRPERIVISPGPCTPHEAGISVRADRALRGEDSDPRRVPGTSGDWRGVWRPRDPRAASDARQDERNSPRRENHFPGSAAGFSGHALPFADRRAEIAAAHAGNFRRDRRRHDHGPAAPQVAVEGVQFHPESVLTDAGFKLLENFLSI